MMKTLNFSSEQERKKYHDKIIKTLHRLERNEIVEIF